MRRWVSVQTFRGCCASSTVTPAVCHRLLTGHLKQPSTKQWKHYACNLALVVGRLQDTAADTAAAAPQHTLQLAAPLSCKWRKHTFACAALHHCRHFACTLKPLNPYVLQEQQRSIASQLLGGAAVAASAALLLLGPLALDAQAVSGGGGISTPLDGMDLSNQVNFLHSARQRSTIVVALFARGKQLMPISLSSAVCGSALGIMQLLFAWLLGCGLHATVEGRWRHQHPLGWPGP
jgi:hypothetical protein